MRVFRWNVELPICPIHNTPMQLTIVEDGSIVIRCPECQAKEEAIRQAEYNKAVAQMNKKRKHKGRQP